MKFMKMIPGGTLLIPMFLSSLIYTFYPQIYKIGGITSALFSGESLNFVLGSAVLISGCGLNIKSMKALIGSYGPLLFFRLMLNILFGIAFVNLFGLGGVLGISAIAFICTITSINPTLFLGMMKEYGDEVDQSAFGFVSMVSTPVVPMFIYGLTSTTQLDFTPILSMMIPLLIGIIIGNVDKELGNHLSIGIGYIIVLLGWNLGASINLIDAVSAGLSGFLMIILYYILNLLPTFFFEKKVLKRKGYSAIGINTIAGISASVPLLMSKTNPELSSYAPKAAAILTFGVVATAIISPILIKKLAGNEEG